MLTARFHFICRYGLSLVLTCGSTLLVACSHQEKKADAPASSAPAADNATQAPVFADQAQPPEPTVAPAPPVPVPPAGSKVDGESCITAQDCASGICEGQGCDDAHPGTCQPTHRKCTYDLRPYCGCDGQTFQASGSCAGRRYSVRDTCPAR